MSTQIEMPVYDDKHFQHHLPHLYEEVIDELRRITTSFFLFTSCFIALFSIELVSFFPLLSLFSHSPLLACFLCAVFVTIFSYVVLLFYFQAKKPEQFELVKKRFLLSCREQIGIPKGESQHHLSIAAALTTLATSLEERLILSRFFSLFFRKWLKQDLFHIKQLLLKAALQEQLQQVRLTPTDLEVHASLANTYLVFSKLMQFTHQEQFERMARLALEEFQIMNEYAPNDPWVHEQLAKGYHDLGMVKEEISELEFLKKLRPYDRELMVQLGTLYFEQGLHARGLRIYEELRQINTKKAEDLIASYGINNF